MGEYAAADDVDLKYRLLREEITRLRRAAEDRRFTENEAFMDLLRVHNETVAGTLLVFAANDFGLPVALRPAGTPKAIQAEVRREILREKYRANAELNGIRQDLLGADSRVHKVLVATHHDGQIDYHLPGGHHESTNFVTVREAVGLVDYTTNSAQADDLSLTY